MTSPAWNNNLEDDEDEDERQRQEEKEQFDIVSFSTIYKLHLKYQ